MSSAIYWGTRFGTLAIPTSTSPRWPGAWVFSRLALSEFHPFSIPFFRKNWASLSHCSLPLATMSTCDLTLRYCVQVTRLCLKQIALVGRGSWQTIYTHLLSRHTAFQASHFFRPLPRYTEIIPVSRCRILHEPLRLQYWFSARKVPSVICFCLAFVTVLKAM